MKQELTFEAEPFQGYTEFDEFESADPELLEAETSYEWMGEVSRGNADYIRWVQQSLNRIMRLRLKEDGISSPQTRSAIRSFQQRAGLKADGVVGPQTEKGLIAAGAALPSGFAGIGNPPSAAGTQSSPGVIAPSTSFKLARIDPTDPRIDVSAKFALQRMLKADPASRKDASGIITAINSRLLAGIFGDDLRASAQLAQRIGTVRWELIPKAEDAALVLDKSGPPAIVFRGGQGQPPHDGIRRIPGRLDPALRKAWASFQLLRTGKIQCDLGVRSVRDISLGRPAALLANVVPACVSTSNEPRCGVPRRSLARTSLGQPTRLRREIGMMEFETPPAPVQPKLCFFEIVPNEKQNTAFFRNQADRWARVIHSIAVPNSSKCSSKEGSSPYQTGADILTSLQNAFFCLGAEPIKEVHFFGHMFEEGIIGTFNSDGIYLRDPYQGRNMEPVNRAGGGRIITEISTGILAKDVVFVLHGCNTATGNSNIAGKLWEHLAATLDDPKVFGHTRSVCVGLDAFWREFSRRAPTGLNLDRIPFYSGRQDCGS